MIDGDLMRRYLYIFILLFLCGLISSPSEVFSRQKPVDPLDVDETKSMIRAVSERHESLNLREEKIREEEERLAALRKDIDDKLLNLTEATSKLEKILEAVGTVDRERILGLAKLYENMPPEEAAKTIEKVERELAVLIIRSMSKRKSGKMMGFVDDRKAARLSEGLGDRVLPEKDITR